MKNKLEKGINVRYVIPTYYEIGKSGYNNNFYYNEPQSNLSCPMLGGVYKIEEVVKNKWNVNEFLLSVDNKLIEQLVPESLLINKEIADDCSYGPGENLFFKPIISKRDMIYLNCFLPMKKIEYEKERLQVVKVINNYYLLVKRENNIIIDFPFLYTDFEPDI